MFKTYSSSSSLVITSRWFATGRLAVPASVRLVYWCLFLFWSDTSELYTYAGWLFHWQQRNYDCLLVSKATLNNVSKQNSWELWYNHNKTQETNKPWWRHQMETFSALLALCAGNSPVPGEFPAQSQCRGALMFSLICARINGWVNNGEAGDFRRHRAHYDVIVMHHNAFCMAYTTFINSLICYTAIAKFKYLMFLR